MKKTDKEIRAIYGGHAATPKSHTELFIQGWRACEANMSQVPPQVTQYIEEVYNKVCGGHMVKKITRYGGSIYVTFDDDRTYRFNVNKDISTINLDELAQDRENCLYLATTLEHDHQKPEKVALLRRADSIGTILNEMKRDRGCCSECGEGLDNEEEWKYNTECDVCGHPIPEHLIIKRK